jgi:hypothetical protein
MSLHLIAKKMAIQIFVRNVNKVKAIANTKNYALTFQKNIKSNLLFSYILNNKVF